MTKHTRFSQLLTLQLALLPALYTPAFSQPASGEWKPKEFPIGYWVGPAGEHQTLERYRELKESGMTIGMPTGAGPATVEENLKLLDLSHKVGLKTFIWDPRMPISITGTPGATEALDAIIKDFGNHPALAGYHVQDEPSASAFAGLAEVMQYLREKDPRHLPILNLLPTYAGPAYWGTATYEEYVERFLKEVKPSILSYDHYNFLAGSDRVDFTANLAIIRRLALKYNVPFWQFVMSAQIEHYRNLTEGELNYQAMQTLVYGGKGLLWFTYWQYGTWSHSLILEDGSRDPHYNMIRRINNDVRVMGGELLPAKSLSVFHHGVIPQGGIGQQAASPVKPRGKGDLTIGIFQRPNERVLLSLVTNANYKEHAKTEIFLARNAQAPQYFNPTTCKWISLKSKAVTGGYEVQLSLPPGGAMLLKW